MQIKLQSIFDPKTCVSALSTLLQESIQNANRQSVAQAQKEIDLFFSKARALEADQRDLEHIAWELYPQWVRARVLLNGFKIPSNEQFQRHGYVQGVIPRSFVEAFLAEFKRLKPMSFRAEDCDLNYSPGNINLDTECVLNASHLWYPLKEAQLLTLAPILAALKEPIAACLGTPWRVLNIRTWETPPQAEKRGPNEWHTDHLHLAVLKIMFYPYGIDEDKGSIAIQRPEGSHSFVGEFGTWVFFRNSEIVHRGVAPKTGKRLAVEFSIAPALDYDLNPLFVGINARFPHLPWLYPSQSRMPFSQRLGYFFRRSYFRARKNPLLRTLYAPIRLLKTRL